MVQLSSNLLEVKISTSPKPLCPSVEKYKVLLSAAINGLVSSPKVLITLPMCLGLDQVFFLVKKLTYKSDGSPDGQGLSITYKTSDGWEVPKPFIIEDYYNDNKYVSYFLCNDNKTLIMALESKKHIYCHYNNLLL